MRSNNALLADDVPVTGNVSGRAHPAEQEGRAVWQLRFAATGIGQTDVHRAWVRAGTRC